MRPSKEVKYIAVKASGSDGSFSGILSTYGNEDLVGDICEHGCFDASVKERGTSRPFLWQHREDEPIGRFEITDTKDALAIAGKFNLNVSRGKDGYELLKAGDISGLSIGYLVKKATFDENGIRHLKDVDLLEGSLVTFPANPLCGAEVKAMSEKKKGCRKALYSMRCLKAMSEDERDAAIAEILSILKDRMDDEGDDEEEEPDGEPKACKPKKECDPDDPDCDPKACKPKGMTSDDMELAALTSVLDAGLTSAKNREG